MDKVTSKYQVTVPKRIAEQYGIAPGDDIEFVAAGAANQGPDSRLWLFGQALNATASVE